MPVGPRCGDKAEYEYEVTSELVGNDAYIFVMRTKKPTLAAVDTMRIKQEKTTVPWPDLRKNGSFHGGRQVCFSGLDKLSYDDKFKKQEFELSISCLSDVKEGDDAITIAGYDAKGPEYKEIGFPVPVKWPGREVRMFNPVTGAMETFAAPIMAPGKKATEEAARANVGKFWIAFKDGEVLLTVKLDVQPVSDAAPRSKIFKDIKSSVEAYWNDPTRGLRQWILHRKDCARGEKCNCTVCYGAGKSGPELKSGGCCKVPVRLEIQEGADNRVKIEFLSNAQWMDLLNQKEANPVAWKVPKLRANTMRLYYPENRFATWAHEVGHMLGLPDQYAKGCVSLASRFPIDSGSIMGSRPDGGRVPKDYITSAEYVLGWVNENVDPSLEPQDRF